MRITIYLTLSLILISCKSEIEKQNESDLILSDSIFSEAKSTLFHSYFNVKVDSIHKIYMNLKEPKEKLAYARNIQTYSLKLKAKRDSITKRINDKADRLLAIDKAKEEKKWWNSRAGKIQKKHPNWSKEDCLAISEHKYWIGMSIDMLKYSRGNPNHANPSNYGTGVKWQWCWDDYTPSCFYGGENGIITSYN